MGTVFNLTTSKSSTFIFKFIKSVRTLAGFLMSSLSTSAFKAIKSLLTAKLDVSTPVTSFNCYLVAQFDNLILL